MMAVQPESEPRPRNRSTSRTRPRSSTKPCPASRSHASGGSAATNRAGRRPRRPTTSTRTVRFVDVAIRIWHRDRDSAGTLVGSAVAFRLFLFFVPMLLFFTGLLGFLAEHIDRADLKQRRHQRRAGEPDRSRARAADYDAVGRDAARPLRHGVGGPLADEGARRRELPGVAAPCQDEGIARRSWARSRVSIAGIALVATLVGRLRDNGIMVAGMSFLVGFGFYVVAWLVLSMLLPRRENTDPSALVPGAVIVAGVLTGMQASARSTFPASSRTRQSCMARSASRSSRSAGSSSSAG